MNEEDKVIVIAALQAEIKSVAANLPADSRIITRVTGIGSQRMVAVATRLIEEHHPRRIILIGFSGALLPELAAGQIIHVSAVMNIAGQIVRLTEGEYDQRTTLLTVDHVVATVEEKSTLRQNHRAAAIDMESFALATLARERNIPLSIIRAISDTADFALPAQIGEWVNEDGSPRVGAVMKALARKPSLLTTLLKLQSHTKTAARNLAAAVGDLLKE